jgi:hypothetical protein
MSQQITTKLMKDMILLTIREHVITKAQNPIVINKYADWDYFDFLLETNIDLSVPLKAIDLLEDELYYFTTANQEAAWKSAPNLRKLQGLNFPKEIREMIAEKRKLKRRWHQTHATRQNKTKIGLHNS